MPLLSLKTNKRSSTVISVIPKYRRREFLKQEITKMDYIVMALCIFPEGDNKSSNEFLSWESPIKTRYYENETENQRNMKKKRGKRKKGKRKLSI